MDFKLLFKLCFISAKARTSRLTLHYLAQATAAEFTFLFPVTRKQQENETIQETSELMTVEIVLKMLYDEHINCKMNAIAEEPKHSTTEKPALI